MRISVLVIVAVIIAVMLAYLTSTGLFSSIPVNVENAGPYTLVYEKLTGDYRQTGKAMDKVYFWLKSREINPPQGFGLYFDDPRRVEKAQLRAIAGDLLPESARDQIGTIREKFRVEDFAARKCIKAEFPFRGKASVMLGILRVYPAINAFAEKNGYAKNAILEIYDIPNKRIIYLMPFEAEANLLRDYFE